MNKRFLIFFSLIILTLALIGGIIFWVKINDRNDQPVIPTPAETPLTGFPVSDPNTNPEPAPMDGPGEPPTATPDVPPAITPTGSAAATVLTKLSPTPVSGAVLLFRTSSTTPATIIYLEEATGNLFRTESDGRNNQKLTENSLPRVARAWWGRSRLAKSDTLTLIAQYLDHQEAVVTLRGTYNLLATSSAELLGNAIPGVAAHGLAIAPAGDRFFALTNTPTGVNGAITETSTGKVRTIFTSHFKNWTVSWPAPAIITLMPRAAAGVSGTLYFLNPTSGVLTRVLAGELGLTTLVNPAGTKVLYARGLSALQIYSPRDNKTTSLTIDTFPEKCVWAKDNVTIYCAVPNDPAEAQYPDQWWSGEVSFNDSFWQVNTDTGEAKIVFANNSAGANRRLDAINLILDETGERLIFTDRSTGELWSLPSF
ncbi:MAG: hypothetical protein AAB415_03340 [Patescibacteria group bacterium]